MIPCSYLSACLCHAMPGQCHLITGGLDTKGMCLSWVASLEEQVPQASPQEEGLLLASWRCLPCWVLASYQSVEDPGDWSQSIASADMDFNQLEAFLTAQTKKQGGITSEQAAVISKFWKSHKIKIRESLMKQSRWDNGLRGLSWRVDGKSQSRHSTQIHSPVAIIELEFGKNGQESEFLCLEFDEVKVKQILKKLSEVEESINRLMQAA